MEPRRDQLRARTCAGENTGISEAPWDTDASENLSKISGWPDPYKLDVPMGDILPEIVG
jgi:hypothetical protein